VFLCDAIFWDVRRIAGSVVGTGRVMYVNRPVERKNMRSKGRPKLSPRELKRRRVRAVRLLREGKRLSEVADLLDVSVSSVRRWKQALARGGLKALDGKPHPGPKPLLSASQREDLKDVLIKRASEGGCQDYPSFCESVAEMIQKRYNVTYKLGYIGLLLRRLGLCSGMLYHLGGYPPNTGRCLSRRRTRY